MENIPEMDRDRTNYFPSQVRQEKLGKFHTQTDCIVCYVCVVSYLKQR